MNNRLTIERVVTAVLLVVSAHPSGASSPGTAGFSFLRTHVGARASAMGGTFIAVAGDLYDIYYNPAGLADLTARSGSLTYLKHVLDFHSGCIAYGQPLSEKAGFCAAINYINFGNFTRTDEDGMEEGTFTAGSVALSAGIGREMYRNLLAGVSVKYFRSDIESYSSDGFAVDAGLLYRIPSQQLTLAAGIFNVGFVNSAFVSSKDDLPFAYRVGLAKRLAHLPLLIGFTYYKFVDDDVRWTVGGEFTITENLYMRWGYDSLGSEMHVESDKDPFAGIAFGFGILWRKYRFDYSFSTMGEIGTQNRITLSGAF